MAGKLTKEFGANAVHYLVIVPEGNGYSNPAMVGRITDHLEQALGLKAEFEKGDDGRASKDFAGAYTLSIEGEETALALAAHIVEMHYGLTCIPETGNPLELPELPGMDALRDLSR